MDQDVALGVTTTVTQADLAHLRQELRLGEFPVVYRVHRQQQGGGFGDQDKHPYAWGVLVYVDGQLARINSARGFGREWNDLARVEPWLRAHGFWYWWTRNDLETVSEFDQISEDFDEEIIDTEARIEIEEKTLHPMAPELPAQHPKFSLK
jgi:hypothetical protein